MGAGCNGVDKALGMQIIHRLCGSFRSHNHERRNNLSHTALDWIAQHLADLDKAHLKRQLAERSGVQRAGRVTIDGNSFINFSSNDYLGLAADRRLGDAVASAVSESGWGSGASPLVTGRASLHARLESELADFEGTEAALLFTSGFTANLGTIAALVGRDDAVFSDAKNHASIIDGCRLSGACVHVYRHRDVAHLAELLHRADDRGRRLIVTDSLFSMDGDVAPLAELAELADRHAAMLMVDEAHATGVFGNRGRGVAELLGVEDRVNVRVGTLSKALGSVGGFVAGSRNLIEWLANRARSFVYSTAMPEAVCAASLEALSIIQHEPQRHKKLLAQASNLREQLGAAGWNVGSSHSQIVPVFVGDPAATMKLSAELRSRGLLVPGIRPPSVPVGESLLRISLSYAHSDEDIRQLCEALAGGQAC